VDDYDDADIKLSYGLAAPLVCGVTYEPEYSEGIIREAVIELDPKSSLEGIEDIFPFLPIGCEQTVKHEIGHALGLLGHTDDGGLMDPDGGNGEFSEQLVRLITGLYSFPPNTSIDFIFKK